MTGSRTGWSRRSLISPAHSIESWTPKPGVQPAVFTTDFVDSDRLVRADPRWKKAMSDRGLKPSDVFLDIWSPGDGQTHGATPGTRLLRAIADFDGGLGNAYDRPIEGVVATVDMNRAQGHRRDGHRDHDQSTRRLPGAPPRHGPG